MNQPAFIDVRGERAIPGGLAFSVVLDDGAAGRALEIRLHWADYNLWSPDGADAPERVALAVARFVRARMDPLPESLDAALLRRRFPDADATIAELVRSLAGGSAER